MAVHLGLARVSRWKRAVMLTIAIAGAVGAAFAWHALRPPAAQQPHFVEVAANTYALPRPDALAEFHLVRHDEAPFSNDSLKGRWSFLIFGYTSCPDFCPTTLAMFNEVHALLAQRPAGTRDVQFVLVSVDPARDTPRLLNEYVPQFNRDFIGVTGDADVIARLADSVGAVYARVPGGSDRDYLIDHSTAVLLVNPQGKLQGIFAAPHLADGIVQGFLKIRGQPAAVATAGVDVNPAALRTPAR